MNIGDKVKPSETCRPLYGDPNYLIIKEIKDGKYLTEQGSTWFDSHELIPYTRKHKTYELLTAQEALNELEDMKTYTREEVYLIAERSVRAAINNILSENNSKPISEIINSEIDTVKLF